MIRFSVFDELTGATIKLYEDATSFARMSEYAKEQSGEREAVTESMVINFVGIRKDGIANVVAKLNRAGAAARARAVNQNGPRVWLQAEYSVTTSGTFTMYRSELADLRMTGAPRDEKREAQNRARFAFVFTRKNWWEMSAEQTLVSSVTGRNNVNCQIDAGVPAGDLPAPVDVEMNYPVQQSGTGYPPAFCWMGNHALAAQVGSLKYWLEPGTLGSGGSTLTSFGAVRGMNYAEWSIGVGVMNTLLFSSDMSHAEYLQYMNGRPFRAFCSHRSDSAMVAVWLEVYSTTGGETLLYKTQPVFLPQRLVGLSFCAFDLGYMNMPPNGQQGLANDTLRVKMYASNYDAGTARINIDTLVFMPLDSFQAFANTKSGVGQSYPFTEVVRNSEGVAFHRDSTGNEQLTLTQYNGPLVAFPGTQNMFYILTDLPNMGSSGENYNPTLKYRPRYVELPGDYA
jgi:hypothetical protein